jgi:protein-disulfide isomerase
LNRRLFLVACAALSVAVTPLAATPVPVPADNASAADAKRYFTEDPDAPMIAPKGYDVTIVEYMDYQCPACRSSHEPLQQLLAKDKKVRVIFRDWPIFGAASVHAALIATASKFQGKYHQVHAALLEIPRPLTDEKVEAAARKAGVDWDRLQKDIVDHAPDIEDLLARNDSQAQMLGLDGTPGFIIGNVKSFGGMTLAQFEESVQRARDSAAKSAASDQAS